jgi:hypothetical protein
MSAGFLSPPAPRGSYGPDLSFRVRFNPQLLFKAGFMPAFFFADVFSQMKVLIGDAVSDCVRRYFAIVSSLTDQRSVTMAAPSIDPGFSAFPACTTTATSSTPARVTSLIGTVHAPGVPVHGPSLRQPRTTL